MEDTAVSPRTPSSSAKRRGNSEGSAPRRRPDGRWQINLRVTDESGQSRHTVYGETPQEARGKASAIRRRVAGGQPARDRRETVAAFTLHWIGTSLQASERKQNTKVMYAGVARTHIIDTSIGRLTLDKLTGTLTTSTDTRGQFADRRRRPSTPSGRQTALDIRHKAPLPSWPCRFDPGHPLHVKPHVSAL
jgi:hypothetical protein